MDGERFMTDMRNILERPCGFDAVMRVRCSGGIRAVEFYGNFYMQNANDIELGMIDSEKSIAAEIRYDDKLTEAEGCCIQIALLYTSVSGQRRLRVFNLSLNASTNMAEVYKSIDADAMLNIVAKSGTTASDCLLLKLLYFVSELFIKYTSLFTLSFCSQPHVAVQELSRCGSNVNDTVCTDTGLLSQELCPANFTRTTYFAGGHESLSSDAQRCAEIWCTPRL